MAALPFLCDVVPASDENGYYRVLLRKINHTGIAAQLVAKAVECLQPFFCLADESSIAFKNLKAERVVDMFYADGIHLKCLAQQYVLIAIPAETLVERVC